MTTFAIPVQARPSQDLSDLPGEFKNHYWGDLAQEATSGSDRGLMQTAATLVESQLKDLLISDPAPARPDMLALIAPGGPLCHRNALVSHLQQHAFMSQREAAAVRSLFDCVDRYFGWNQDGALTNLQWLSLEPFLAYTSDPGMPAVQNKDREGFFWACREITDALLILIGNRENGLA